MKPIKFDLPMNGTKIATLEQLKDNLTPEILESFRSGKLTKWLRVRNLIEQANQIDSLLVNDAKHEMELVKSLYRLFDTELNETVLQTALAEYKKLSPSVQIHNVIDDEIEQLTMELSKKEREYQQRVETIKDEFEKNITQIKVEYSKTENKHIEKYNILFSILELTRKNWEIHRQWLISLLDFLEVAYRKSTKKYVSDRSWLSDNYERVVPLSPNLCKELDDNKIKLYDLEKKLNKL